MCETYRTSVIEHLQILISHSHLIHQVVEWAQVLLPAVEIIQSGIRPRT